MTGGFDNELLSSLGVPESYGDQHRRYPDATELEDVEANIIGRMQQLVPRTAQAWREMKRSAAADGVELLLVSGFRSAKYQAELFRNKLASGQRIADILEVNAAPGYSQHHSGQAVDIATPGARPLTEDFDATPAFAWLIEHAESFGFRMPYGRDNAYGFIYEPWHWSTLEP